MSTIQTLSTSDTPAGTLITKFNANFSALNTDKAELSGGTFTGDISVPDEAYGVGWNGSTEVPTKNAIYDAIQALPALTDGDKGDITVSSSGGTWTIDNNVVSNAKLATVATATFKGRTTAGTGNVEDLTATQATALLNTATTSLKGLMSSADKTKLDSVNTWTLLSTITLSGGLASPVSTGTMTSYDYYKIVYSVSSSTSTAYFQLQLNSVSSFDYTQQLLQTSGTVQQSGQNAFTISLPSSGYCSAGEVTISAKNSISQRCVYGTGTCPNGYALLGGVLSPYSTDITSLNFLKSGAGNLDGTIKIYGMNS